MPVVSGSNIPENFGSLTSTKFAVVLNKNFMGTLKTVISKSRHLISLWALHLRANNRNYRKIIYRLFEVKMQQDVAKT